MIAEVLRHIVRFTLLILAQVLVLKNLEFGSFLIPFVYIAFLLLLPLEIPGWLLLLLSFLTGLLVDVFYSTPGMHTFSCLTMALFRPLVLKAISPRDGYDFTLRPTSEQLGIGWFISYISALVFVHHFTLFMVESFRWNMVGVVLGKSILSALLSVVIIVVIQFFFHSSKKSG